MRTWTENGRPIPPRNTVRPEWKELAPWVAWILKTVGLVILVLVTFDAGASSEAQGRLDALDREHEADVRAEYAVGLLRRYVPAGEGALAVCLELRAELRSLPSYYYKRTNPLRRADN